jgi:hypothetical protein
MTLLSSGVLRGAKVFFARVTAALYAEDTNPRHLAGDLVGALAEGLQAHEDVEHPEGTPPSARQLREQIVAQVEHRLQQLDAISQSGGAPVWMTHRELEAEAARLLQLRSLVRFLNGPALLVALGNTELGDGRSDYLRNRSRIAGPLRTFAECVDTTCCEPAPAHLHLVAPPEDQP